MEKRGDGEKSDEENEEKEGSKEKSKEGDEEEDDNAAEQEEYDEEEQEEVMVYSGRVTKLTKLKDELIWYIIKVNQQTKTKLMGTRGILLSLASSSWYQENYYSIEIIVIPNGM